MIPIIRPVSALFRTLLTVKSLLISGKGILILLLRLSSVALLVISLRLTVALLSVTLLIISLRLTITLLAVTLLIISLGLAVTLGLAITLLAIALLLAVALLLAIALLLAVALLLAIALLLAVALFSAILLVRIIALIFHLTVLQIPVKGCIGICHRRWCPLHRLSHSLIRSSRQHMDVKAGEEQGKKTERQDYIAGGTVSHQLCNFRKGSCFRSDHDDDHQKIARYIESRRCAPSLILAGLIILSHTSSTDHESRIHHYRPNQDHYKFPFSEEKIPISSCSDKNVNHQHRKFCQKADSDDQN